MASEDVIELGSSDDETEPAPKKSKPMPNAMVCIPRKLHDVTIRPAKLNPNAVPKGAVQKVVIGKGLTIGKPTTLTSHGPIIKTNPFATKPKTFIKPAQKIIAKPQLKLVKPITIQKPSNSNSPVVKTPNTVNFVNNYNTKFLKKPIKIQNPKTLNNLPPSITVKRTTQLNNRPIVFMNATNSSGKINTKPENDVPTVELMDDDESPEPASGPAWYLRPEEQTEVPALELENNKEPEPTKMVEITIEDSPIKLAQNKRTCEVGTELAITIDDSPVKITLEKHDSVSGSDNEETDNKVPHSKKKLEYPKEADNLNRKTVEIEIDIPPEVIVDIDMENTAKDKTEDLAEVTIIENKTLKSVQKTNSSLESGAKGEFHAVYQSFIDTCFQLENSDDMKKIVDKKIKAYYRQVPIEYTESEEFIDMVASKILAMKASPEKMYLYIKDIVDELNIQRKFAKSQVVTMEPKPEEPEQLSYGDENEYDTKRQRQIRKLEKTIKKLHRAIQKLEEQEVDFDDEDDSVYLLTERYKERMVRVYAKFCQLTNTKMPSEPRIQIDARLGQPTGPAKRLEKWINKKVPIGTPLPFPDFHDVLRCVRDANDEDKLCWNEADIMEEARDLFTRCGKKLQRRRQENEWRLAASRIALDLDPAENNDQLKIKLEENRKLAANKEADIFNKYADRQNQLKLEAEEIGDKEAEESPEESEEEEGNDESVSLENKEKRKERLKRLLQERSKRASEGKDNQLLEDPIDNKTDIETFETDNKEIEIKDSKTVQGKGDDLENTSKTLNDTEEKLHKDPETLSVSDDSNNLESDIDELHLLQKLHSENEAYSSTLESSDSESPIAISDSLESGSDSKKQFSDVISIENSSYSESEADNYNKQININTECTKVTSSDGTPNKETETPVHAGMESECSIAVVETEGTDAIREIEATNVVMETESSANAAEINDLNTVMESGSSNADMGTESLEAVTKEYSNVSSEKVHNKSNNDEYHQSVENILLASSSDEESSSDHEVVTEGACNNLCDNLISIDETVVGGINDEHETDANKQSTESYEDQPSSFEINAVIVNLKNDDIVNTNSDSVNNVSSKNTSHEDDLIGSIEHAQSNGVILDETKSTETVEYMDVDEDKTVELEKKSNAGDNIPPTLSSEN